MEQNKKTILKIFEENEKDISRLYRIYSQKIQGHKKFWEGLSKEEIGHSLEIAKISQNKKLGLVEENSFSRGIVKYVSDFVNEQIEIAKKEKLSHLSAINVALRIEQSMLERKCFEIFIPAQDKLKDVLEKLNKETEKHVGVLQKELKKYSKK
ncbi:MAG: hypothetical protein WC678_03760 [Parcubacteria group bacterium]|jgi:hypothetical protein